MNNDEVLMVSRIEIETIHHGQKSRGSFGSVKAVERIVTVDGEVYFRQWKKIKRSRGDNNETGRLLNELEDSLFSTKQPAQRTLSDKGLKVPKKRNLFSRTLRTIKVGLRFLFSVDNSHCRFAIVPLPSKQETELYAQRLERIAQLSAAGYQVTVVQEPAQTQCGCNCRKDLTCED